MQTNYLPIFLILTFMDFSLEENANEVKNINIDNKTINIKGLSRKEESSLNEVDSLLKNMNQIYENRLSNLNQKINQLLDFKEMINKKQEETRIVNGLINDLKLLKREYSRNMNFTYILFGLFLCINIIFSIYDCINKSNIKRSHHGYRRTNEEQNNQISIE